MNTIVCLAFILLALMLLVGGRKGARSFIALFLNFGVVIVTLFFLMDPAVDPVILTLIACTVISAVNLFYINEINSKTVLAFVSTLLTIAILLFLIYWIAKRSMIQGFSEEEADEISIFSLLIGVDFVKIAVSMIIMSTIGAITDVAIAISSPAREVFLHHPDISRKELFQSGMRIGRDILGSDTNTLFFAFIGGYMALLIWFRDLDYSIGQIVNSKVFGGEMLIIFSAGIGIALIIPIAAGLNAWWLTRQKTGKGREI
ncbi:YibE/F family protein [Bhargavaea cecembensis]|uniref:YibE/F family protein n=1 Tax=Bhargavaea cecembensis TaxID=394098 RepID=UPI00058B9C4B|nr:YibE/F family protein [Bhargavaea cecembensis]